MRWFQGFQTRRSGETAKMRLKLLLVSDKAGCSPEMILMIKDDVIHAISKYMPKNIALSLKRWRTPI